jgi:hypothetical protein
MVEEFIQMRPPPIRNRFTTMVEVIADMLIISSRKRVPPILDA